MIILISGFGKTRFCKELHNLFGRHQHFSLNDGTTVAEVELFIQNRNKIKHPCVIFTGSKNLVDWAEGALRATGLQQPIFRMVLEEPNLV